VHSKTLGVDVEVLGGVLEVAAPGRPADAVHTRRHREGFAP
jgi:hypothetical protein